MICSSRAKTRLRSIGGLALVCASVPSFAQQIEVSETIVVSGRRDKISAASFETRHILESEEIETLGASSADEIIRQLPSSHVPTNSRGERIVFVRNAGERQVAVFYEGAAINVPWDNRLDLGLLPAGLVGSVQMAAGPLAPHYGVNAIAAVRFSPRDPDDGPLASFAAGNAGLLDGQLSVPFRASGFTILVGASHAQRDGDQVSHAAILPFSQASSSIRTNTDRRLGAFYGRLGRQFGAHQFAITAFHVRGEKGIAPESDRQTGARFWRYPAVRHTLVSVGTDSTLGTATRLSSALWLQRFGQTIDSYTSKNYETIGARQVDRDHTFGIRELLKHKSGPATFVASFNFLASTHRQRDIEFAAGNPPPTLPAALKYRQRNWSVGGEVELALSTDVLGEIGIGYDKVAYLQTGDKPPIDGGEGWSGRAGMVWKAPHGLRVRAAAGRKLRVPTMRELFGQTLNRFLINPDLKPERIISAELGLEWRSDRASLFVIPFLQELKHTIEQRNVGRLRQRINLKGSRVRGIEIGAAWQIGDRFKISGNATLSDVERKGTAAGETDKIAEKPVLLARLVADYGHLWGLRASLAAEHVGRAYSADVDGVLVPLALSTSFNGRLGYGFELDRASAELFVDMDNMTDTHVLPQIGLPAPGRAFRVGLRIGRAPPR